MKPPGHRPLLTAALVALMLLPRPEPVAAQADRYERGVTGAGLLLRQLDGVKRVLMIGAHPDDEDTSLLSTLARGLGAETAYLSLTRGDGGQNLIGPELNEGLGVVRTGELLAARALDGGRQYFTRAFDYGYSKNAEEAFSNWPREELLGDVVRVVRTFRPQIIISVFSGTPADGHGQHQAAGIMAQEAFRAAGDPTRFPEQLAEGLTPWQPSKLYQRPRGGTSDAPVEEIEIGSFDPLLGRSHLQLAMESRSQHRSQDMGQGQPLGPRSSGVQAIAIAEGVDAAPGDGLFAGVDTALVAFASKLQEPRRLEVERALEAYRAALADARGDLSAVTPWEAAPALARGLAALRAARSAASVAGESPAVQDLTAVLDRRIELIERALLDASGVVVEVRASDDLVVPGQTVRFEAELWNGGPFTVEIALPEMVLPAGWRVVPAAGPGSAEPATSVSLPPRSETVVWRWDVTVPADADLSEPYYIELPRTRAMYRWPDEPSVLGLPKDPPVAGARVGFQMAPWLGELPMPAVVKVGAHRPARYVGVDKATGEFEQPLLVVPAVSVGTEPGVMVVPVGRPVERTVTVSLTGFAPDGASGTLRLETPAGWSAEPASVPFDLSAEGEERSVDFTVRPPASPAAGRFALRAVAETAAGTFVQRVDLVDYPHIERTVMLEPAETRLTVVPVAVDDGRVGYVMGSGDDGFAALREMGVDAELLGPDQVQSGDLSRFDVIVTGIRAYEVRPDLIAANQRVLDFARAGGTVVVQYNKYEFPAGDFAPYPVEMSRPHDRVTDEASPVAFLHPAHPVFNEPNVLDTTSDWEGYVTERGLYFLGDWDERYTPLLELTDPGEEPTRGSLVAAPVGDGLWLYTGLSFFRQLPEGVPGAYRLFANLVSLDRAAWDAWAASR